MREGQQHVALCSESRTAPTETKTPDQVADMSFFEFLRQLEYKTGMHGGVVNVADRFFSSSKTCSDYVAGRFAASSRYIVCVLSPYGKDRRPNRCC
jgi:putative transposase